LGEEVDESMIVQKVIRSLPIIFNPDISSLEEISYLGMISMDELHGIFTFYEMRAHQENPYKKESYIKASKKIKKKKRIDSKPNCSCSDDSNKDEEIDKFVRKLKKGIDKYKGMFPFKGFNCGKLSHF
jgi:hypothetical protein